jgi:hypothetical protein
MMLSMDILIESRMMHHPMKPIEPCITDKKKYKNRKYLIPYSVFSCLCIEARIPIILEPEYDTSEYSSSYYDEYGIGDFIFDLDITSPIAELDASFFEDFREHYREYYVYYSYDSECRS